MDKERFSVIFSMNLNLELCFNPLIDTSVVSGEFKVLEFKKKLTTIYLRLIPDNFKKLQPIVQVFYQQAIEFYLESFPNYEGVMFMTDQFLTFGKIDEFMVGTYFSGYYIRLFLIIQDIQQLKGIYEEYEMNSFLSNSTYRIAFFANNYLIANLILQLYGDKAVEQIFQNKFKFLDFNSVSRFFSISETQRVFLFLQKVINLLNLFRNVEILLIGSTLLIKSNKIRYYLEAFFKKRLLVLILSPKQKSFDLDKLRITFADDKDKGTHAESSQNLQQVAQNNPLTVKIKEL